MNRIWSAASFLSGNLVRTSGKPAGSAVYLTFDDGPDPEHTVRVLDLLAQHGAKGTFFLIGRFAEQSPEIVRRMLEEGHAIGNHSMTHPKMRALETTAQWDEIDRAEAVLQQLGGSKFHSFRPPNGRVTSSLLAYSLWRRRPLVLWTIDSHDYKLPPQDVVKRLQEAPPVAGDVILFHDDTPCAGNALEVLLPAWKMAGLQFPVLA